jgi:hypothetical protein
MVVGEVSLEHNNPLLVEDIRSLSELEPNSQVYFARKTSGFLLEEGRVKSLNDGGVIIGPDNVSGSKPWRVILFNELNSGEAKLFAKTANRLVPFATREQIAEAQALNVSIRQLIKQAGRGILFVCNQQEDQPFLKLSLLD